MNGEVKFVSVLIGGAEGHSDKVKESADLMVSLVK